MNILFWALAIGITLLVVGLVMSISSTNLQKTCFNCEKRCSCDKNVSNIACSEWAVDVEQIKKEVLEQRGESIQEHRSDLMRDFDFEAQTYKRSIAMHKNMLEKRVEYLENQIKNEGV